MLLGVNKKEVARLVKRWTGIFNFALGVTKQKQIKTRSIFQPSKCISVLMKCFNTSLEISHCFWAWKLSMLPFSSSFFVRCVFLLL